MQHTRIFISSPGDLASERLIANKVIERLKSEFGHRGILRCEMWENQPLLASDSFQNQIVPPEECDILVLMLWNRMGTPLPAEKHFKKDDGSDYLSGTEFEYLSALKAYQQNGKPQILVYKKELSPTEEAQRQQDLSEEQKADASRQKLLLTDFIKSNFTAKDDSLTSAYHLFAGEKEFENRLEGHLAKLLDSSLPDASNVTPQDLKQWHRGSPFVGLESFGEDHAKVFFGRKQDIKNLSLQLVAKAKRKAAFQVVLGMSGCGKSSLVKAGLLPEITGEQNKTGINNWRTLKMKPSEVEDDLLLSFCYKLTSETTLGKLIEAYKGEHNALKQALISKEPSLLENIKTSLQGTNKTKSALLIIIDQTEELFTHDLIKPQQVVQFANIIKWLVESELVWCVMTLRADFYAQFTAIPAFASLKANQGQYDLSLPTEDEIGQIIRLPAKVAGLTFEINEETGESLYDQLKDSAAQQREILPLLQFSLEQLYLQRSSSDVLTLDAYHRMGGIEGALAQHAEQSFLDCKIDEQDAFSELFNRLVDFDQAHENRFTRRVVSLDGIDSHAARDLAQSLIEQRLLVLTLQNNKSFVAVAHESLFNHWPRLKEWIANNKENIAIRQKLLEVSSVWLKEGKPKNRLYSQGKLAEEAKQLQQSGLSIEGVIAQFIRASQAKVTRFKQAKYAGIASLLLLAAATTYAAFQAKYEKASADRRLTQSEELVSYMLTDLRKQLEPIGKLDILGKAGEATVNYFRQLPSEDLSETNLTNKARALYQLGEVQFGLGKIDKAKEIFAESFATSEALLNKNPSNQTMLFEHAQAAFWVGYMELELANYDGAIEYFNRYLEAAKQLVKLDSQNADFWIELGSAYANIGGVYHQLGRVDEAEGVLELGIKQLDQATSLNQESTSVEQIRVQVNSLLANVYAGNRDYKEEQKIRRKSITILKTAMDNNIKDLNTELIYFVELRNLAISLYNSGEIEQSGRQFKALVKELRTKDSARDDFKQIQLDSMVNLFQIALFSGMQTEKLNQQIDTYINQHRKAGVKAWERSVFEHSYLNQLENLSLGTITNSSCKESFKEIDRTLLKKEQLLQLNTISADVCFATGNSVEAWKYIVKAEKIIKDVVNKNANFEDFEMYTYSLKTQNFTNKAEKINNPLVAKRLNQLATYKE